MSGSSGLFSSIGGSLNEWTNTANDNINQALSANQSGKQFNKTYELSKSKDRRDWEEWGLKKLQMQNQLADESMTLNWKRAFRNALSRGTTFSSQQFAG